MQGYVIVLLAGIWCVSCSTVRKLGEEDVLYTGVKKINIEVEDEKNAPSPSSSITSALSYPPNNPLYAPYVRTPFPTGLWVYNWNVRKQRGFKHWLYKKLAKQPVLVSDVQPDLRLKVVENTAKEYGYFGMRTDYRLVYNKRNPKKAKITYDVWFPRPLVLGNVEYWGWRGRMDTIVQRSRALSPLKSGMVYDLSVMNEERERLTRLLRGLGYYYFQSDYIEILVDTTRVKGTADVRVALKTGVPELALMPCRVGEVSLVLSDDVQEKTRDTLHLHGVAVHYNEPLDLRPKVIERSVQLRPGDLFSLARQSQTQAELGRLGIFKYTNLEVVPMDSANLGKLDVRINAVYDLPVEMECELGVSSKSNNLLGPGLAFSITNKNAFRGGENLSFKLNGAYEWQTGKQQGATSSGLINSYELGLNVGLSVPRLLVPKFLTSEKGYPERTNFQVGADLLNRHTFFRMISFSGSATYEFQSSRRMYHSVTPMKINYTYLLETSPEFDETMENNPAIALSFDNQFIPSISYTNTYDRGTTLRNPNRFYWQNTITAAGNLLSAAQWIFGNDRGEGKKIFGNPYSQFLKLTSEMIVYRRLTERSQLAFRFMGGIGYAYGNSSVMPYSEQFYIGGANSIRAFTIRSLGPGSYHQESDNSTAYLDQTGDIKLEGNVELRFKIMSSLNAALFVDAGNVWLLRGDEKRPGGEFKFSGLLDEIALGTGFGLRYDIGFIVIRADLGVALHTPYKNPDKSGYYNISKFGDGIGFHLAIGYPF